jgi:hypothetical protein
MWVGGGNAGGVVGGWTFQDVWNPDKTAMEGTSGMVGLHNPGELVQFAIPLIGIIVLIWALERRRIRVRGSLSGGAG